MDVMDRILDVIGGAAVGRARRQRVEVLRRAALRSSAGPTAVASRAGGSGFSGVR